MVRATIAAMPNPLGTASRVRRPRPGARLAIIELWHELKCLFNPYRPELNYMRGAGPKWREKHGNPPPSDAASRPEAG